MNKRITKKRTKLLHNKFDRLINRLPSEEIKTDKKGRITNWNELSDQTKDWIING